jgi:hypothetical protein
LAVDGPVAVVTAGWQEREGEVDELREHLGRPVINLELYRRLERVFADDPELSQAHRARQKRLRAMQRLYRYRLDFALEPARELLRRVGDPELLEPEREAAIETLRSLDARQLERIREVHAEFERRHAPARRPAMKRQRLELAGLLEKAKAVAVAGGHVAVLLNRMRLFAIETLFGELPVFAWSAGAMALSERVVLFHDSPPQGMGNPEVLDVGLALFPDVVVLPHARHRLRLEDPARIEILARRFGPAACVPFEPGSPAIRWQDGRWILPAGTRRLTVDGRVVEVEDREESA